MRSARLLDPVAPCRTRRILIFCWMLLCIAFLSWNVESVTVEEGDVSAPSMPPPPFVFGVMVDSARHAFPVEWLLEFVKTIHKMGLNTIHLTITNDQRFGLKMTNKTEDPLLYSLNEWKKLVDLSRSLQHNNSSSMTILPEMSLPIYTTAWATAKGLVGDTTNATTDTSILVDCPKYICNAGFAVPLNMHHPKLKPILRSVFQKLMKVLDRPPLLHLGSNDVSLAEPCWMEAMGNFEERQQQQSQRGLLSEEPPEPDYDLFEEILTEVVVKDLGYDPQHIIRQWNMDKPHSSTVKDSRLLTGTLSQYKNHDVALKDTGPYLLQPKELNLAIHVMDQVSGWDIYQQTLTILDQHGNDNNKQRFRGLLISTEALDATMFRKRNIMGRLLAISMAVQESAVISGNTQLRYSNRQDFEEAYLSKCQQLFAARDDKKTDISAMSPAFCQLRGGTIGNDMNETQLQSLGIMSDEHFKDGYGALWQKWRNEMCERLTEVTETFELQSVSGPVMHSIQNIAFARYWQGLGETEDHRIEDSLVAIQEEKLPLLHESFDEMKVPYRGVILDAVERLPLPDEVEALMEQMSSLGLNTLQLSLLNGLGTSLSLEDMTLLYHMVPTVHYAAPPMTDVILRDFAGRAKKFGIQIIPEVSMTTQATGWYHAGFLLNCPKAFCDNGMITNDVTKAALLPVLLEMIRRLHSIFIGSSPFIHLGSDERNSSQACWEESGKHGDYDKFESLLSTMLMEKNWYNSSTILRWENKEGVLYKNRTGLVTQYQHRLPSKADQESPFFGSIDAGRHVNPWEVYSQTLEWVSLKPKGLLVRVSLKDFDSQQQNLVAFAAGLSTSTAKMNDEELTAFLSDVCNKNSFGCPPDEFTTRRGKQASRLTSLCKSMTKSSATSTRKMRDEALPVAVKSGVVETK